MKIWEQEQDLNTPTVMKTEMSKDTGNLFEEKGILP